MPKKYLEQIRAEDPRIMDAAIVATAQKALEVYSDDALPIVLVKYDQAGEVVEVLTYGDRSVFPVATATDQAQLS